MPWLPHQPPWQLQQSLSTKADPCWLRRLAHAPVCCTSGQHLQPCTIQPTAGQLCPVRALRSLGMAVGLQRRQLVVGMMLLLCLGWRTPAAVY
jgi:hypothetical protein